MYKGIAFFGYVSALLFFFMLASCHDSQRHAPSGTGTDSVFHSQLLQGVTDSIRRYPDSSRLYFERGGLLYVMKEYELAAKDIQRAIALDPLKSIYYISLGEIKLAGNDYSGAAGAYRRAALLDPDNLMARLQLAYVYIQQKDYPGALAQTDTLLKQDDRVAEAYGLRAQAFEGMKDTARALDILKKAVSLAPGDYDALMAVGDILMKKGNTAALSYYRRARKADTTQGEPLYCMGLFHEAKGDISDAIAAYKACIERDAYYLDAYLKLGPIYEHEKDWVNALKVYNLATKIDPTSSVAFYQRGVCHENLKNLQAARNDYLDALSLKKDNREARTALDRLNGTDTDH